MDLHHNQSYWIPLSDLMTGLMMVFLLIAVSFMLKIEQTTTMVIKEYQHSKTNLSIALKKEFGSDLSHWHAKILSDMTIRFEDPNVLFDIGSYEIKPAFKTILDDFIPRYIKLVSSKKYADSIKEIRIEGHTSSRWATVDDPKLAYINNMRLSQKRAQAMLEYILSLTVLEPYETWLEKYLTANGFSSSKPIYNDDQIIDDDKSQRIEFVIITNADLKMDEMFHQFKKTA